MSGNYASSEFGNRGPVGLPGFAISPYGARTFYVHHNGAQAFSDLPPEISDKIFTKVHLAMSVVENDRGDIVQMLPGHAENIDSATYITQTATKTGWALLGPAFGPPATLTWSTATSVFSIPANAVIDGGRSNGYGIVCELAGDPALTAALSVAAPFKMLASGCGLTRVKARMSIDADQLATIPITFNASGDDCFITNNFLYGATAGEVTTGIDIIGADNLLFANNYINGATSAVGVGIVRFATTVSLHHLSVNNTISNLKALSTAAVTGLANVSGASRQDHFHYLDNTSLTAWLTSRGIMTFHRPTVTNDAAETGTENVGVVSS